MAILRILNLIVKKENGFYSYQSEQFIERTAKTANPLRSISTSEHAQRAIF